MKTVIRETAEQIAQYMRDRYEERRPPPPVSWEKHGITLEIDESLPPGGLPIRFGIVADAGASA